jgi:hypothetical protein
MQIRWGGTPLEANGAGMAVHRRTIENAANVPYQVEVTAAIEGWVTGTTAQIIQKCQNLEAALKVPFQDLVLLGNDGSVLRRLDNAGSVSGTRVVEGPDYPEFRGAELVNYQSFRFVVQATYPLGPGPVLVEFHETLDTSGGGGPIIGFQRPFNAKPIEVQLYPAVEGTAIQTGFATANGLTPLSYPAEPGPLFPTALLKPKRVRKSSDRAGSKQYLCRVEWEYEMGLASGPLTGAPNAWK